MEHPENKPDKLVQINRVMRVVWGLITAVLFMVLLFIFLRQESGY